jgi:hypothetical protein
MFHCPEEEYEDFDDFIEDLKEEYNINNNY